VYIGGTVNDVTIEGPDINDYKTNDNWNIKQKNAGYLKLVISKPILEIA